MCHSKRERFELVTLQPAAKKPVPSQTQSPGAAGYNHLFHRLLPPCRALYYCAYKGLNLVLPEVEGQQAHPAGMVKSDAIHQSQGMVKF